MGAEATERKSRQRSFAALLYSAVNKHSTQTAEAARLGVSAQRLQKLCDADRTDSLQASDIAALSPAVRVEILTALAAADGYTVTPLPSSAERGPALEHAATAQREYGEGAAAYLTALAVELDPALWRVASKELHEAVASLVPILHLAQQRARDLMPGARSCRPEASERKAVG